MVWAGKNQKTPLWEDRGAIKAFGELRRLRVNVVQDAVEWRVSEQRLPIEKIGGNLDEAA